MFDLGAPLVYDRPVVADVRSFFLGVGGDHQAAVKGLKSRLLKNVTILQLEYMSPDREPAYRSLLETSGWGAIGRRWQHADESTAASSTGISVCLQNVAETVNMLGPAIKLGGLLPNLRTVNLAAHSRFTWQATEIKIQPPGFVVPPFVVLVASQPLVQTSLPLQGLLLSALLLHQHCPFVPVRPIRATGVSRARRLQCGRVIPPDFYHPHHL